MFLKTRIQINDLQWSSGVKEVTSYNGRVVIIGKNSYATGDFFEGQLATTTELLDVTYDNGVLGAGATLTSDTNVVFPLGGQTSDVVLVKDQTDKTSNGLYGVTQVGSASVPWILTRLPSFDTLIDSDANEFLPKPIVIDGNVYTLQPLDLSSSSQTGVTLIEFSQYYGVVGAVGDTSLVTYYSLYEINCSLLEVENNIVYGNVPEYLNLRTTSTLDVLVPWGIDIPSVLSSIGELND